LFHGTHLLSAYITCAKACRISLSNIVRQKRRAKKGIPLLNPSHLSGIALLQLAKQVLERTSFQNSATSSMPANSWQHLAANDYRFFFLATFCFFFSAAFRPLPVLAAWASGSARRCCFLSCSFCSFMMYLGGCSS
jgi:hypothetical protein